MLISDQSSLRPPTSDLRPPTSDLRPPTSDLTAFQERVGVVGARLDRLEAEILRDRTQDAGSPPSVAPRLDSQLVENTGASSLKVWVQRRDEQLVAFEREAVDPVWAPAMSAEIDEALSSLAKSEGVHFRSSVECRNSTCVARLSWPDFKTARAEYMLADTPSMKCARSLLLDEPTDAEAPFEAKLIYTCMK